MGHKKYGCGVDLTLAGRFFARNRPIVSNRSNWMVGLVLIVLLFGPFSAVWSNPQGDRSSGKEEFLRQAKELIDGDENNRADMQRAISILQAHSSEYPDEILLPLYLAQAYYLLASSQDDIDSVFPYYEKTGNYAQQAMKMDGSRPESHYWYGLFLLRKAEKVNSIRAFFHVRKAIRELEQVRRSMPEYDHAGASRVLCLLRYLAPGWTPFGDLDQSIELGEEAVRIDPNYPLNRLSLADAYNKRGDKEAAILEYRALLVTAARMPNHQGDRFRDTAQRMLRSYGESADM